MAQERADDWTWWKLALALPLQLWIAHALVFFAHEYAHAFTAWALGWKSNPLALHWPALSPVVWLIQLGINQGVDEGPIYAAHRGGDAALIAAAGMVIGNGLVTMALGRLGYRYFERRGRTGWALLCLWIVAASIGNLLDYVPIRTFTTESDMGSVERGFGWSPWVVLILFGAPILAATLEFFLRFTPKALTAIFPGSAPTRMTVAILCSLFVFGFYGCAGLLEGGPISRDLSLVSEFLFAPLVTVAMAWRVRKQAGSPD